jgi:hypothetical protein
MSKTTFKKDKNWKKFELALDPKNFESITEKEMHKAIKLSCLVVVAKIRETMKKGDFDKNAPLTVLIKGDSKPLIGYRAGAQLFGSVTHKVEGLEGFVGVLKTNSEYGIAVTLHDGKEIKVTPKMRGMFFALWQASQGKLDPNKLNSDVRSLYDQMSNNWLPLKKSTTSIIIPPRPFITDTFSDTEVLKSVEKQLSKSFGDVFTALIR